MSEIYFHIPAERGLIRVSGEDRQAFLQGLISNDTAKVADDRAIYATLLTAQGRFLFDLFIAGQEDSYLVDCAADRRADLIKRLSMYRLRAKVAIGDVDSGWCVALLFGTGAAQAVGLAATAGAATAFGGGIAYVDPRLAELGVRLILPRAKAAEILGGLQAGDDVSGGHYHRLRASLGVPDAPQELVPEKSIPLENGLDELNAIDWQKGCYMGQELTARTRYRGLVRKRLLPVRIAGPAPEPGTPLLLGDKEMGEIRSVIGDGTRGFAMVRLEALAGGMPEFSAGGAKISPDVPGWMRLPELDEAKA
ncbi:MAG TPA: folate-binding protein [Dongiaceae bacterium]|nr:folate-binding protein [Dongiaceae bacterium]